jgi:hypothetical protein
MLAKTLQNIFVDRRKKETPSKVPKQGCRRIGGSLRTDGQDVCNQLWYLQTSYLDQK